MSIGEEVVRDVGQVPGLPEGQDLGEKNQYPNLTAQTHELTSKTFYFAGEEADQGHGAVEGQGVVGQLRAGPQLDPVQPSPHSNLEAAQLL